MYLLFPGRHHLLTRFQHEYLSMLGKEGLWGAIDVAGKSLEKAGRIKGVIFAVTSANHNSTRRNPLPLYQRAMMIQDFSSDLGYPSYVVPIDDIGLSDHFAEYTIKKIEAETDGKLQLTPNNAVVLCSTPVMHLYQNLGYSILPVERIPGTKESFVTKQPWQILESIAVDKRLPKDQEDYVRYVHPASKRLWEEYGIVEKVKVLFADSVVGDDGDLTESRDYNTYVREMDEIAELKFNETKDYIRPGRIGDIGCAVGSWIKLATEQPNLIESDFYGVEIARKLYDICHQRKENGDFSNTNVFFLRKNAVTGLVFPKGSMKTIHTSSLTHEIESYGDREKLLSFISNRYEELAHGGVWINRDVVGPEDKDKIVYLWLNEEDGNNDTSVKTFSSKQEKKNHLDSISTYARFFYFQKEFRKEQNYRLDYEIRSLEGKNFLVMSLQNVCEFLSKKDYTDNWDSEMHESFCFWSFEDWKTEMKRSGFTLSSSSRAYSNPWIVENRFLGKAALYETSSSFPKGISDLQLLSWPVTHMLLVAAK
ncbi:transferase [Leptospira idonii]|uniref:Transferase n=1 Tax=Leptospira idonii TaxID=1193500 RepID=A0A4R9LXX9_9LEPT|nr:transferase [Leptospira idonii]TGN19140.1 transferase [Leptospira idonii]